MIKILKIWNKNKIIYTIFKFITFRFIMIERKVKRIFIFINLLLILIGFLCIKYQSLQAIDDFFYTIMYNISTDSTYKKWQNKIVLVWVDSKFFSKEWVTLSTFHRWYYAKLNNKLNEYWVENIIYDVFFQNLKYGTWNELAQRLYKKSIWYFDNQFTKAVSWNVVIWTLPQKNTIELPSKKLIEKGVWLWIVKSHENSNNINDWTIPYIKYWNKNILTLWYSAYINRLILKWKIKNILDIYIQKRESLYWKYFLLNYLIIKTDKWDIKIPLSIDKEWQYFNFSSLAIKNKIKTYSLYDIIHDDDNIYEDKFKWKTVFIWATDHALNDIKNSYIWMIPWVMFHINNFLSIYWKDYFYILPIWDTFIILVLLIIIWSIFVVVFKNEKLTFVVFLLFVILLFSFYYYWLFKEWIIIPIWTIFVMISLKLLIDIVHILFINQEKSKFLSSLFDKYVGSKIREEKEEATKTSNKIIGTTKNKDIALMFSDIASFTNISEQLKAEEVGDMLNIYFEICGRYLNKSKAYVDKYIWDAIMAYWEDLEYLDKIIKTVVNIQKAHSEIMLKIKNDLWKDINIITRIWLHYWDAIVWDIWDKNWKIQPTAIWDNVNLASRLEGINKYYNTHIIISEEFYKKIKNKEDFAIRKLDKITVKWKTEPVVIYEVIEYLPSEINSDIVQYINNFETALEQYFKWNFEKAEELFNRLYIFKIWKNDKVIKVFIERLDFLLKHKPENWDWVWRYKSK